MAKKLSRQFGATDPSGRYVVKRFASLADGRDWQAKMKSERQRVLAGLDLPKKLQSVSIANYVDRYIERRQKGEVIGKVRGRKRQPATRGYWQGEAQRLYDYVLPLVGNRLLGSISSEEWELIFDKIQANPVRKERIKRLSESTINKVRAVCSRLYEDAIIEGFASHNPIRETASRDEGDPDLKSDYWDKSECIRYLKESQELGTRFFFWAILELNSGARIGELMPLTHADIDSRNGYISIYKIADIHDNKKVRERNKGKKSRVVGMNNAMIEAYLTLTESLDDDYRPGDFVFNEDPSKPGDYHRYYKLHKSVCDRAKVKSIRVHDMRHTYASNFMMQGGNLSDLSEVLGHKTEQMTKRYAKFSKEHLKKQSSIFEVGITKEKEKET